MKVIILAFAICMASQACFAQPNFYYASGRLFVDPETSQKIHSPYLAYYLNDELQWLTYDPDVAEGRFVSNSSTYSTAVACGYIKGSLDLLENRIVTPSDTYTGIAISVMASQKVEWFYAHNPGIVPSKFHWVQKLRDGMTLLSGHEYTDADKTAILLRIDKEGNTTWTRRIQHAIGLEVRSTMKDRIFWMLHFPKTDEIQILELNQFTGEVLNTISIHAKTSDEGLRLSKTFFLSETKLLVARLSTENSPKIQVDEYDLNGKLTRSVSINYRLDYNAQLELQGITLRPDGNIQLALNLNGTIAIQDEEPITSGKSSEILLITLDGMGIYLGNENYGSDFASVSGIYQINDRTAIAGCYIGAFNIQSRALPYTKGETEARPYVVYLDTYDPIADLDLPFDPGLEISQLTLYPNPITTEDVITVTNEKVVSGVPYEIRVYDNTAKLQFMQTGKTKFESSRDELNITSLPSGIFHVFVIQQNAVISQGKFIISR